ncbi:MAG: DUF1080 domain-containing protein [Bacteroidales bacterium]|nr:DUF1080 domain-containing protein [Bacteroidales bacterium]
MKSIYNYSKKYCRLTVIIFLITSCNFGSGKQESKSTNRDVIPEGWESLFDGESLEGWEITNFGTQGPVNISEGNIILGMGDGCTGITWTGDFPVNNYEVSLEAKKISGNDFFCGLTFPVDDSYCSLIVGGWGGPVVGLSIIDGLDASENETRILKKFDHDKWYRITLKVADNKIKAWVNDEEIINFSTEGRILNIRPEVSLSTPFGICSWVTTAAIKNIMIKS